MRKSTNSDFTGGLNTDIHPLSNIQSTMTDCVNGTFITQDGNEMILQNDKGNVFVEDTRLHNGFIPIGVKEYGNILYIASLNPLTGEFQLGSFPGPEYEDFSGKLGIPDSSNVSYINNSETDLFRNGPLKQSLFQTTNNKLYPGDKYVIGFTGETTLKQVEESSFFTLEIKKVISENAETPFNNSNIKELKGKDDVDYDPSNGDPTSPEFTDFEAIGDTSCYLISEVKLTNNDVKNSQQIISSNYFNIVKKPFSVKTLTDNLVLDESQPQNPVDNYNLTPSNPCSSFEIKESIDVPKWSDIGKLPSINPNFSVNGNYITTTVGLQQSSFNDFNKPGIDLSEQLKDSTIISPSFIVATFEEPMVRMTFNKDYILAHSDNLQTIEIQKDGKTIIVLNFSNVTDSTIKDNPLYLSLDNSHNVSLNNSMLDKKITSNLAIRNYMVDLAAIFITSTFEWIFNIFNLGDTFTIKGDLNYITKVEGANLEDTKLIITQSKYIPVDNLLMTLDSDIEGHINYYKSDNFLIESSTNYSGEKLPNPFIIQRWILKDNKAVSIDLNKWSYKYSGDVLSWKYNDSINNVYDGNKGNEKHIVKYTPKLSYYFDNKDLNLGFKNESISDYNLDICKVITAEDIITVFQYKIGESIPTGYSSVKDNCLTLNIGFGYNFLADIASNTTTDNGLTYTTVCYIELYDVLNNNSTVIDIQKYIKDKYTDIQTYKECLEISLLLSDNIHDGTNYSLKSTEEQKISLLYKKVEVDGYYSVKSLTADILEPLITQNTIYLVSFTYKKIFSVSTDTAKTVNFLAKQFLIKTDDSFNLLYDSHKIKDWISSPELVAKFYELPNYSKESERDGKYKNYPSWITKHTIKSESEITSSFEKFKQFNASFKNPEHIPYFINPEYKGDVEGFTTNSKLFSVVEGYDSNKLINELGLTITDRSSYDIRSSCGFINDDEFNLVGIKQDFPFEKTVMYKIGNQYKSQEGTSLRENISRQIFNTDLSKTLTFNNIGKNDKSQSSSLWEVSFKQVIRPIRYAWGWTDLTHTRFPASVDITDYIDDTHTTKITSSVQTNQDYYSAYDTGEYPSWYPFNSRMITDAFTTDKCVYLFDSRKVPNYEFHYYPDEIGETDTNLNSKIDFTIMDISSIPTEDSQQKRVGYGDGKYYNEKYTYEGNQSDLVEFIFRRINSIPYYSYNGWMEASNVNLYRSNYNKKLKLEKDCNYFSPNQYSIDGIIPNNNPNYFIFAKDNHNTWVSLSRNAGNNSDFKDLNSIKSYLDKCDLCKIIKHDYTVNAFVHNSADITSIINSFSDNKYNIEWNYSYLLGIQYDLSMTLANNILSIDGLCIENTTRFNILDNTTIYDNIKQLIDNRINYFKSYVKSLSTTYNYQYIDIETINNKSFFGFFDDYIKNSNITKIDNLATTQISISDIISTFSYLDKYYQIKLGELIRVSDINNCKTSYFKQLENKNKDKCYNTTIDTDKYGDYFISHMENNVETILCHNTKLTFNEDFKEIIFNDLKYNSTVYYMNTQATKLKEVWYWVPDVIYDKKYVGKINTLLSFPIYKKNKNFKGHITHKLLGAPYESIGEIITPNQTTGWKYYESHSFADYDPNGSLRKSLYFVPNEQSTNDSQNNYSQEGFNFIKLFLSQDPRVMTRYPYNSNFYSVRNIDALDPIVSRRWFGIYPDNKRFKNSPYVLDEFRKDDMIIVPNETYFDSNSVIPMFSQDKDIIINL